MSKPTITCPGCTCLCDDIEPGNPGDREFGNACETGRRWFTDHLSEAQGAGQHQVNGQPTSLDDTIKKARELITSAVAPIVCGLENLTIEAQQEAWKLAESIRGSIDTSLSNHRHSGISSLQKHGKVTATLGEIAQRSNLIVCWFCDPANTHPRLLERLKRTGKRLIVVDEAESETAKQADWFLRLPRNTSSLALAALIASSKNRAIEPERIRESGLDLPAIESLANELANSQYGAICYSDATPDFHDSQFDVDADQLALLVRGLNSKNRVVSIQLRSDANGLGSENVMAWSGGFPAAANYARSLPRHYGNEYTAEKLLSRRECDLVILGPASSAQLDQLSDEAREQLGRIPVIELTNSSRRLLESQVTINVAMPGIDDQGDYCRLDNIALPLNKLVTTERPPAAEVLRALAGND